MRESERKKKTSQEERIKELEEKIKKLEEAKGKQKEKDSGGVASSVLEEIRDIIPGLGNLIRSVGKSEAFKERLEEINEEVDRRLKEEPLKKVKERTPHIRDSFSARILAKDRSSFKQRAKESKVREREPLVDIFDEGDYIKVIAELPGVEEKDIKIDLKDDKLTLSADTAAHKYHQQLTLPCSPKGKLEKVFRNGILELKITKKPDHN